MKTSLSLLATFLISSLSFAQLNTALDASHLVDIQEGEVFKTKNELIDIFGHDDDFLFARQMKTGLGSTKHFLAKFDSKTLDLSEEVEINMEEGGSDMDFERLFMLNGTIHLFTSFANRSKDMNYLFHQTINPKSLKQNGDIKKIGEHYFENNKDLRTSGFSIEMSQDTSKIMVYYNLPFEKKGKEKYGVAVFTDKMEDIWSSEIELPYEDELFSINDFDVANDGSVIVQGKLWKEKSERERKEVNYKYLIIQYPNGGGQGVEYDVNLDGKFVKTVSMRLSTEGKILMGGFYKEDSKASTGGSFFLMIDRESKEILHKSYEPFELDFITSDLTEKQTKKTEKKSDKGKDVGIGQLTIDGIRLRDDGGFAMVGERYWVTQTTYTDSNGMTRTRTTYHYWDIIIVNVSPEGEIEWNAKIPKRQSLGSTIWSSYVSAAVGSSMFFIYNDSPKNLYYNGDGKLKNFSIKDPLILLVEVDSDGKVFRRSLLKDGGKGSAIFPSGSEQISDDTIILYSGRGKKKMLTKVKFRNTNM